MSLSFHLNKSLVGEAWRKRNQRLIIVVKVKFKHRIKLYVLENKQCWMTYTVQGDDARLRADSAQLCMQAMCMYLYDAICMDSTFNKPFIFRKKSFSKNYTVSQQ